VGLADHSALFEDLEVSILVVMETSQWAFRTSPSETEMSVCFNPCCDGNESVGLGAVKHLTHRSKVSILVVMETSQWANMRLADFVKG